MANDGFKSLMAKIKNLQLAGALANPSVDGEYPLCGTHLKEGSVDLEKLNKEELEAWIIELLKKYFDEEWFIKLICDTECPEYLIVPYPEPVDGGTVEGGGLIKGGRETSVIAHAIAPYYFIGWYDVEGNKLSEHELYSFTAEKDMFLYAKFKKDELDVFPENLSFAATGESFSVKIEANNPWQVLQGNNYVNRE